MGEWQYSSTFMTLALVRGEWSASCPGSFTPEETATGTHWTAGWEASEPVWMPWRRERSLDPPRDCTTAIQPAVSPYTKWAILSPSMACTFLRTWEVGNWSMKMVLVPHVNSWISLKMFQLFIMKFITENMYLHGEEVRFLITWIDLCSISRSDTSHDSSNFLLPKYLFVVR
jgi:hypothetical protein